MLGMTAISLFTKLTVVLLLRQVRDRASGARIYVRQLFHDYHASRNHFLIGCHQPGTDDVVALVVIIHPEIF